MVGRDQVGYGILGTYLKHLMPKGVNLLRAENYPNLYSFTRDMASLSDEFTKSIECRELNRLYPTESNLGQTIRWVKQRLHELVW